MTSPNSNHPASSESGTPDPGLVTATIERLRREQEATEDDEPSASLLHEIALLEERMGDEGAAARDQLAAVNLQPDFREPLEQLISIIQRRQSYKNLGKLLERLVKLSTTPAEFVRAQLDHAAHLARFERNPEAARAALEDTISRSDDSSALWFAFEVIAGKLGQPELRTQALKARLELTQHSTWRALLGIDLARLSAEVGEVDAAVGALTQAIEQAGPATFAATRALEQLARKLDRKDLLCQALETRATLLQRATEDASSGDSLGVPKHLRDDAHLVLAWLVASEAERAREDFQASVVLLDKALERLPEDPILLHARLNAAEGAGDTQKAASLAQRELDRGAEGALAAALWLRVAEAAAAEGDGPGALQAVGKALEGDPACVPARALQLDLLSGGADAAALASALEETAEKLPTEEGKANYYLAAADVWTRLARDQDGAKAALSQAGLHGASPGTLARVARLLASELASADWYDEATRRLVAAGAEGAEKLSLWFELVRGRALRGDLAGAREILKSLAETPDGAWFGNLLGAYVVSAPHSGEHETDGSAKSATSLRDSAALEQLAALERNPASARALKTIVALRNSGNAESVISTLERLHDEDAADPIVATALAGLLTEQSRGEQAAKVTAACAEQQQDTRFGAALSLQAGMAYWRAGDKKSALSCFERANELHAESGAQMLSWALRAAEPNDPGARRRALEAAENDLELSALERFALEIGRSGNADVARTCLMSLDEQAPEELREAGILAKVLWSPPDDAVNQMEALASLSSMSGVAPTLSQAAEYLLGLDRERAGQAKDAAALEAAASGWAASDNSLVAALEWLGSAVATKDIEREVSARRAVAQRVDPAQGAALEASASLLNALGGADGEPLLTGTTPAARLGNLELALPGSDPRKRASAFAALGNALGDDSLAMARAVAAYNQLAQLDAEGALKSFRSVVEAFPQEVFGWEGLRAAALALNKKAEVAEASAALGDATRDDELGAQFWEEAAMILMDELDDAERGEFALARAVDRDVRRFAAFDRLFRIVRARKDGPRLLELVAKRLEVAEDPEELAKLFWERARVLREAGDQDAALSALENVTMLEADHVGALALAGEIQITKKQFPEAAEKLARLSTLDEAPRKQRLMSGVAAADIYEKRLGDVQSALSVLLGLHEAGLSTLPVRERLARAAATAEDWDHATQVLEQLMEERDTSDGRVEAARLAMVVHRDRRNDPNSAGPAVLRLLKEVPDDGEALELVLSGALPEPTASQLLLRGQEQLVERLGREPLDGERVDRLARIALRLENAPLRQAALGALVAIGDGSPEIDRELEMLDQRVAHIPQTAIDDSSLPDLADAEDGGPVPDLMLAIAETLCEALGPNLETFGVGRKQKVSPRAGLPLRNEVAHWAGALGVGEFDLYIGGPDDEGVFGIASNPVGLIVGKNVSAPLNAQHRQLVARELYALRRGTSILRHREPADIAALIVAAGRVVGVEIPSQNYALIGEFERQLSKALPRRVKKQLSQLATSVADGRTDPIAWYHAATSSLDRMAAIAAGDVSWVLADGSINRGRLGASIEAHNRAARLLSFVLSHTYLNLRQQLGMGVR